MFFKKSLGISLLIRTMVAASGRYGAGFAEVLLEEHPTSRTVCAAGARDSRVSTTHAESDSKPVRLLDLLRER